MRELQRKNRIKKIIYSPFIGVVLLVLLFFLSKATYGLYQKKVATDLELRRAEGQLKMLTDKEKKLKDQIMFLNTDRGVESEIRQKFRVVKPGEELSVIVDGDNPTASPATATGTAIHP
ncbi:MAG: hypothetical protein WCP15_00610 [bacterium]